MSHTVIAHIYSFFRGDPFALLPHVVDFRVSPSFDAGHVSTVMQLEEATVFEQIQSGGLPYIGYYQDQPVGSGWSRSKSVYVPPLEREILLPASHRVIRDLQFKQFGANESALPQLIQGILKCEIQDATHVWLINYQNENTQGSQFTEAGFTQVGEFIIKNSGQLGVIPHGPISRALLNPLGHELGFTAPLDSNQLSRGDAGN